MRDVGMDFRRPRRGSLVIKNETRWNTAHLRAIVRRVIKETFAHDEFRGKRLVVTFKPARRHMSGHASLGGSRSTIRMPNPRPDRTIRKASLASLIAHELAHNAGMRNERIMRGRSSVFGWALGREERYAWMLDMPLEPKAPRSRSPRPTDDARAEALRLAIARWETKAKRAATAIRKYRRRLVGVERRMAARKEQS